MASMSSNGEKSTSMIRDVAVRLAEINDPLALDALNEILRLRYDLAHLRATQRLAVEAVADAFTDRLR